MVVNSQQSTRKSSARNPCDQAIESLDEFIKKHHSITVYQDANLMALKLAIHLLEHELEIFDAEKVEPEKLLTYFNYRHNMTLSDLISEILSYKIS